MELSQQMRCRWGFRWLSAGPGQTDTDPLSGETRSALSPTQEAAVAGVMPGRGALGTPAQPSAKPGVASGGGGAASGLQGSREKREVGWAVTVGPSQAPAVPTAAQGWTPTGGGGGTATLADGCCFMPQGGRRESPGLTSGSSCVGRGRGPGPLGSRAGRSLGRLVGSWSGGGGGSPPMLSPPAHPLSSSPCANPGQAPGGSPRVSGSWR